MRFTLNKCLGAALVAGILWLPAMLHGQENAVPTKVLAEGTQEGRSGDTKKIMIEPHGAAGNRSQTVNAGFALAEAFPDAASKGRPASSAGEGNIF